MLSEQLQMVIFEKLEEIASGLSRSVQSIKAALAAGETQGDPDLRSELKYYSSQLAAYSKAQDNWNKGLRPTVISSFVILIPSGTRGGLVHRMERPANGGVWVCSCEATGTHWHQALVSAVEWALDQQEQGLMDEEAESDEAESGERMSEDRFPLSAQTLCASEPLGSRLARARASYDWAAA
jgi:hypothetical protein